ncbi:LysR family transcriptional regulator [Clostridium beijerinckii]|uniref:LysR family transcriptional regulator n=1 Tax=Clostridium beijerinckii TaxID=1520 RepID=UPI00156E28BC|nr:LysR family transcriptional regulator [Clostridium beijerinckii]NRT35795.1 DNA-binding transcriptional LysR family regulator [Clostridium beijerinckii]NRT44779.1 DNA-binding transcriptional LysR family regulator [Clostridium beijerinckii]NRZ21229.1 DNA-binding transcriptional LysR family regulator [Clostridium beijerinckii]UYZ38428.1 LysR family transcriptional regulator [Clostridium beijerinckii]
MNEQLNAFIQVAESGSFSKAAKKLFVSPTAVMKQINSLEKEVGVPLFIRTNHGVELTDAGKSFNKDAEFILQYFQEALLRTRNTTHVDKHIIQVGTSILNPCKVLLDLWNEISNQHPQFEIKIVPFEDDAYTLPNTYRNIGKHFDFIVGPFLTENWNDYSHTLKLGTYRFCFAVSRKHRLASKKKLSITDLYGEKLVVIKGGTSASIDEISEFFIKNHPEIHIKSVPRLYDIDVFNRCGQNNLILLTLDAWSDIHPSLVTIPSDLDFTIPYGLFYPLNPSKDVIEFLEIIKEMQTNH